MKTKKKLFDFWDGIDLSKGKVGNDSEGEEYFHMNVGSDKYHAGGNSCTYKGKTFTCIVKSSEGGGISGHILTNLLIHLDDLKLYDNDRKNGIITTLLIDGHVSRFDMGF